MNRYGYNAVKSGYVGDILRAANTTTGSGW